MVWLVYGDFMAGQWGMALQCYIVSHWLGAYTEWSLRYPWWNPIKDYLMSQWICHKDSRLYITVNLCGKSTHKVVSKCIASDTKLLSLFAITVTSHENHGVSHLRQCNCLFNSRFGQITNMWKRLPCCGIILFWSELSSLTGSSWHQVYGWYLEGFFNQNKYLFIKLFCNAWSLLLIG